MKKVMAGIDLHSNNVVIGIMDTDGKRVTSAKLPCELKEIAKFLAPFKKRLEQVAVESTYNWYWLVDGLQLKYPVVLANPAAMQQYSGIKHADDTNDAFFLAELVRLKILPTGHIYDAQLRPVRDLLRQRMTLVHQRTALMLSFKSLLYAHYRPGNDAEPAQGIGDQRSPGPLRSSGQPNDRRDANQAHGSIDRKHREN